KQGVKVNFGVEVTPEIIDKENADIVVIATGATPAMADFIDITDVRVVNAWDILAGLVEPVGQKVVILGGNMLGCEVSEFLAAKGNLVSVIKMRPGSAMAEDCEPTNRRGLLDSLKTCTVNLLSNYKVEGLTDDGVKVVKRDSGEEMTLKAETIVLALGSKPERGLVDEMQKKDRHFYHIGDCREPKNIRQAIYEGALIGRQI
ncbi:MAG: FAD-dependent oxidoreductase, partial [Desulfobacterales bacterium]